MIELKHAKEKILPIFLDVRNTGGNTFDPIAETQVEKQARSIKEREWNPGPSAQNGEGRRSSLLSVSSGSGK